MTNTFQVSRNWSLFYIFLSLCFLILTGGIVFLSWRSVLLYVNSASRDILSQVVSFFGFVVITIGTYICVYVTFFSLYRGCFERLKLKKSGLEYKAFGRTILVKWKQIDKIDKQLMGTLWLDGLSISEVSKITVWFPQLSNKKYFIPLSLFDITWRDSELGAQIKQYAPHLFK